MKYLLTINTGLFLIALGFSTPAFSEDAVQLRVQRHGLEESFRGIAVRSASEAWVSGTGGTVLRTTDAGQSWQDVEVGHDKQLDFRDIALPKPGVVVLMSAGLGEQSRIFRSTDNGTSWDTVLLNPDAKGFFNAITFSDAEHGVLVGDPIEGRIDLYKTSDAGETWQRGQGPIVADGEYCFAASGTNIAAVGQDQLWLATGGARARVFFSADGGLNWETRETPMLQGNESSGIFSIAFRSARHGVIVGGDYKNPDVDGGPAGRRNVAWTSDGGVTWVSTQQEGRFPHKACTRHLAGKVWLAVGRTGVAITRDDGATWDHCSKESFYTCDVVPGASTGWMAGKDGRIARFTLLK